MAPPVANRAQPENKVDANRDKKKLFDGRVPRVADSMPHLHKHPSTGLRCNACRLRASNRIAAHGQDRLRPMSRRPFRRKNHKVSIGQRQQAGMRPRIRSCSGAGPEIMSPAEMEVQHLIERRSGHRLRQPAWPPPLTDMDQPGHRAGSGGKLLSFAARRMASGNRRSRTAGGCHPLVAALFQL